MRMNILGKINMTRENMVAKYASNKLEKKNCRK